MRGATFTSKVRGLVPANLKRWELQTEKRNHTATWKPANRYNRRINNWKSNRGVNQVYRTEVQKNSVGPPSPWAPFCTGFWNAVPMQISSRFQPCLWLPPCLPLLSLSPWFWYLAFWFFCSWKWPLLLRINLPPSNPSFVQKAIKLSSPSLIFSKSPTVHWPPFLRYPGISHTFSHLLNWQIFIENTSSVELGVRDERWGLHTYKHLMIKSILSKFLIVENVKNRTQAIMDKIEE